MGVMVRVDQSHGEGRASNAIIVGVAREDI
ncbi:uncharacterized protein G2W53_021777 [Senna tora]|uniref:Uncharacterized protein n=1 Tax=Senna tora TaxID=362788 RepID=A0A834TK40_9FABA|nr:uncharacterized protein G2W53_021777 [Senna tora]